MSYPQKNLKALNEEGRYQVPVMTRGSARSKQENRNYNTVGLFKYGQSMRQWEKKIIWLLWGKILKSPFIQ